MQKTFLFILLFAVSCAPEEKSFDATGNFEATEITISAEQPGKIQWLSIEEGMEVAEGDTVGLTDTTFLHLKKRQLEAQAKVLRAKYPGISSELDVLSEQKANLLREITRFSTLADSGAVPRKQADDLRDQFSVLEKRMQVVRSQNAPLAEEGDLVKVQIEQIDAQIEDAFLIVPASGTVLMKLAEAGEFVTPGMPIFRMADLSALMLRAYVSAVQIDDIRIGQEVLVRTDKDAESYHEHKGVISWISQEAEFTPKFIQTKAERTDLVYAMKIRVPNDGTLKLGMPAEVIFTTHHTVNDPGQ